MLAPPASQLPDQHQGNPNVIDEEAVMRLKLTSEDRPLRRCTERLVELLRADSDDKRDTVKAQFLLDFYQLEHALRKHRSVQNVCVEEIQYYEQECVAIGFQIDSARLAIEKLKEDLAQARIERQHKLEYDQIGNTIQQLPSQEVTKRRIEFAKQERERLKLLKEQQDSIIEQKKELLRAALEQLKNTGDQLKALTTLDENQFYTGEDDDDDKDKKATQ